MFNLIESNSKKIRTIIVILVLAMGFSALCTQLNQEHLDTLVYLTIAIGDFVRGQF